MKQILVFFIAIAITLALAGLSFSGEMQGMNHGQAGCKMATCGSCCNQRENQVGKKTDYTSQKRVINIEPSETQR